MVTVTLKYEEAFGARTSLYIREVTEGECQATYTEVHPWEMPGRHRAPHLEWCPDAADVTELRRLLRETRLPLQPEYTLGMDGYHSELEIDAGLNTAAYRWWMGVPEAWRDLRPLLTHLNRMVQNGYRMHGDDD